MAGPTAQTSGDPAPVTPQLSPRSLRLPQAELNRLIGHAYDGFPNEACGLLVGPSGGGSASRFEPCRNQAGSSRIYTIDPKDQLRIDREADDQGLEVVGVVHSHTHTEPYPSPTDVAQAQHLDSRWHFVIVSLAHEVPRTRSYQIVGESIAEEAIVAV